MVHVATLSKGQSVNKEVPYTSLDLGLCFCQIESFISLGIAAGIHPTRHRNSSFEVHATPLESVRAQSCIQLGLISVSEKCVVWGDVVRYEWDVEGGGRVEGAWGGGRPSLRPEMVRLLRANRGNERVVFSGFCFAGVAALLPPSGDREPKNIDYGCHKI